MISYEITVLRTDGGLYGTAVTTGTGLLDLLSSLPGSRLSTGTAGAVEIRRPDGTTERRDTGRY